MSRLFSWILRPGLMVLGVLGLAGGVRGEMATLTPVADTSLWGLDADYNLGGQRDLPAGTVGGMGGLNDSRIVIRFDVASAIPAGSTVTAATLRWTVTMAPESGAVNSTFTLHRMLVEWEEGAGRGDIPGGRVALAGESTWNRRVHPDTGWGTVGGQEGVDFAAEVSASAFIQKEGAYSFTFSADGLTELEAMTADPGTNFGWLLRSASEGTGKTARRFASRESLVAPLPQLEITYTPPPAGPGPAVITGFSVVGDTVDLRFLAEEGVAYRVESSLSLDPESWGSDEEFPAGDAGERTFLDDITGLGLKFYRVMTLTSPP